MTYLAFDIDGTLFNSEGIVVEAFQIGILKYIEQSNININVPAKDKIISLIGLPMDLIFHKLFPQLNAAERKNVINHCTTSLAAIINNGGGKLYDHVFSTIEKLHKDHYKIFIASNGKKDYIEAILNSNNLIKFIEKPIIYLNKEIQDKADIVRHYKKRIKEDNLLIMIGDRESDREAAQNNNIPFIGCAYGHVGDKEIKGTRWITSNFKNIPNIIKEIEQNC
ncbi:MAG: HAD hydrolase-like protein [Spirochaetota bacterium]|nr:HAD hydrolase-like protein [Spirochaetota bacterium]